MSNDKAIEKLIDIYIKAFEGLKAKITAKATLGRATAYERSLLKQVKEQVDELKKSSSTAVKALVKSSYKDGLDNLLQDIKSDGIRRYDLFSGLNVNQINLIADNLTTDLNKAINLIGRRYEDNIRRITLEATAKKLSQGDTIRTMQKQLAEELTKHNYDYVEYADGKKHNITDYANMAARSTTSEAQNTAKIVQGTEWGYDLVRMTSHYPTCEICAKYQDRVYALTKEAANGKYKDKNGKPLHFPYLYDTALVDGYNTIHPNCSHRLSIISANAYTAEELAEFSRKSMLPFEDTRSDAERKQYAAEQAEKRKRNASYRRYQDVKAHLPNDAPKTFSGWQRMKQTNSQRYQDLMEDYKTVKKSITAQEKSSRKNNLTSVDFSIVDSPEYKKKFKGITGDTELDDLICEKTRDILNHRNNTLKEDMYLIDTETKLVVGTQRHSSSDQEIVYNKSLNDAVKNHKSKTLISIHNHPESKPPSGSDLSSCGKRQYQQGIIGCHNGDVYIYKTGNKPFTAKLFDLTVAKYINSGYNANKAYETALNQFVKEYGIRWEKR